MKREVPHQRAALAHQVSALECSETLDQDFETFGLILPQCFYRSKSCRGARWINGRQHAQRKRYQHGQCDISCVQVKRNVTERINLARQTHKLIVIAECTSGHT